MPLYYLYIALLIFSVLKRFQKINASANRVEQEYHRNPFAIPASEIMVKLKEITCMMWDDGFREKLQKTQKMGEWRDTKLKTK